ncbi:MAG: riboflavin biosynthesis protein RibF [Lachnospiraceae bacterium]|jgi:riboflavin kinase/FMN adenylyltransferase|nr:riboflavin biosynthesis protein RibF [Lachnospiraceae bacterium]
MKIIREISDVTGEKARAVTIGKFDGVHQGHRLLLAACAGQKKHGLTSTVVTFTPTPEAYFTKTKEQRLLSECELEAILAAAGIEELIYFPLHEATAKMTATAFTEDFLIKKIKMKYICAGDDFRFGSGGQGNKELLLRLARQHHFTADFVPKMYLGEREISSTYAREAVGSGNMALAADILGDFFPVSGVVTRGKQLGRKLGFPTANVPWPSGKIIPPYGVYLSRVRTPGGEFTAISNIGTKPTVNDDIEKKTDDSGVGIETYIYDYNGDLYDEQITVTLTEFLRPERKFPDIFALKEQVMRDIEAGAKQIL